MQNKIVDVTRLLYENHDNDYITSEQIAYTLGVSKRTVLTYLDRIRDESFGNGFEIVAKQGYGCKLNIKDINAFDKWFYRLQQDEQVTEVEKRRMMIFNRLISSSNYVNIYDLADDLCVSVSSARKDISSLKSLIEKYHLQLKHSRSKGYVIVGEEKDIRNAIAKECSSFIQYMSEVQGEEEQTQMLDLLHMSIEKNLAKKNISISHDSVRSLAIHILIAINRIETNNTIKISSIPSIERKSVEYKVVERINRDINRIFGISLPKEEVYFLCQHIRSQNADTNLDIDLEDSEVIAFLNLFLKTILEQTRINFFDDDNLRNNLINHIFLFLKRLKSGDQIVKSNLSSIKDAFPYANELTVIGLIPIEKKYKTTISEEEKLYFAIHLELSLETNKDVKKYNLAVVLNNSETIFRLISLKINQALKDRINIIKMFTSDNLFEKDIEQFDIIVNASAKKLWFDIPTISIGEVVYDSDIELIKLIMDKLDEKSNVNEYMSKDLYFKIDCQTKEELLMHVAQKAADKYGFDAQQFYDSVMARESYSSTSYSKRIAIPHPIESNKYPNFIAICRLNKPILWSEDKYVQIVFLFSLHGSESTIQSFYKELAKLIQSPDKIFQLQKTDSYEEFVETFYR